MPKPKAKPFAIPKQLVWEAYRRVAANKGAPGVDGQALDEFDADRRDNLYKIWNRMSSGSYFPPPVRAVEIPKPHDGGVRVLGVGDDHRNRTGHHPPELCWTLAHRWCRFPRRRVSEWGITVILAAMGSRARLSACHMS
jgi:hypothetical protein